ncbi:oligopeptidase B [Urechidicola sp. KH5]
MKKILVLAVLSILFSCTPKESIRPTAPVAKKIPDTLTIHNDTRIDNYFWMRLSDEQKNAETPDAQTQDVLNYLNEENDYLQTSMKHTEAFQSKLYDEMVGRLVKDEQSVPVKSNGYLYYSRYEEGKDYPLYCRKKIDTDQEEIMLNGPEMAQGYSYFGMGGRSVSPDNKLLSFAVDTVSRRQYNIYFKNLETGELLPDQLTNNNGSTVWANDNKTVFYTTKDPVTLRANKVWRHTLGTSQSDDVLVHEETDETFFTGIYKSKSNEYIFIYNGQTLSTELMFINANKPNENFKLIQPREVNLEYSVDHYKDHFYIRTNHNAKNFKLVKTPISKTNKENWVDVIPHNDKNFFVGFDLFKNHIVISQRENGLMNIIIKKWSGDSYKMEFNDPAYDAYTTSNLDFDTDILRYYYTSMTTPGRTIEHNMNTKEETVLKQQKVLDDSFTPENYVSERLFATAADGTKIPVSIVYKKGLNKDGKNPLLLYAYGSYGSSQDATFSSTRLTLLNRGFVYALAHVRGGEEMGRDWYENGKLLNKINTFTDFNDTAEFLIKEDFTNNDQLYAYGGSAGGLLMGAIANMRPDLYNGIVAAVPFVDVVSTMLDETIPLTTFEFDEWGNPKNEEYYHYMKSYSPYDNIEAKDYPNLLVTTGYWDSQVQYWEPAKWVAKLRELKTDDNLLIMDCNMDTGHGGASGRYEKYKRTALVYSFMFDLEGISK